MSFAMAEAQPPTWPPLEETHLPSFEGVGGSPCSTG